MINPLLLDILVRKVKSGEILIEQIKLLEYKVEVERTLTTT